MCSAALPVTAITLAAAGGSFSISGRGVTLKTVEQNDVVYVETDAAFKSPGATVSFDKPGAPTP